MADEKQILNDGQGLEDINAGYGSSGYYMTVGNCNGSYLALRPQPVWDQYNELAKMWPGNQVFTYGAVTRGTGLNGIPCSYTYVCYNGTWGWANSSFLR
jgi:hypothetical protein